MSLLEEIEESDLIVLDVETLNVPTFTGKSLLGVAIGIPMGLTCKAYYILPEDLHLYKAVLNKKTIIAHNILFDSNIMAQNDCPLDGYWWDTMVMAHLANENEYSYGLGDLCTKYIGRGKTPMKDIEKAFGGWNNIPKEVMGPYAKNDVSITWELFLIMRQKLADQQLLKLWDMYNRFLKALRWIEEHGVPIDWNLVHEKRLETEEELRRIEYDVLGYDPSSSSYLNFRLYKQLGLPVLSRTEKTGNPQTNIAVLNTMKRLTARKQPEISEEIGNVIRFRQLQKANGNWYAGYERYKDTTGLIHPNFKPHGTATGRLSCETPNLQQIPRDYSRVKVFFRDWPGYVLYELDYSQIELRVGAYYAKQRGDSRMFDTYVKGEDVHALTANLIGAYSQIENPYEARQVGKTGNFLWIYGGGAKRMASQLYGQFGFRASVEQCDGWTRAFHAAYPGFQACIRQCEGLHRKHGYITYWNGRRRRIRERDSSNRVKHRDAFNGRVQGGCSQLLADALIRIHMAYENGTIHSRVVNTVHDSIWVLVPEDRQEEEVAELTKLMRRTPEKHFQLPFEVDAKVMVK